MSSVLAKHHVSFLPVFFQLTLPVYPFVKDNFPFFSGNWSYLKILVPVLSASLSLPSSFFSPPSYYTFSFFKGAADPLARSLPWEDVGSVENPHACSIPWKCTLVRVVRLERLSGFKASFAAKKRPASPKTEVCLGHILTSQTVQLTWMSLLLGRQVVWNSPGPLQLLSAAMRFLLSDVTFSFLYVSGCIWLPTSASQPASLAYPQQVLKVDSVFHVYTLFTMSSIIQQALQHLYKCCKGKHFPVSTLPCSCQSETLHSGLVLTKALPFGPRI